MATHVKIIVGYALVYRREQNTDWGESYKVRYIWCGIFNYGKLLSHISTMSASVYASLSSRAFNAFTFWAKEKHPEGCSLRKCYAIIFIGNIGHA